MIKTLFLLLIISLQTIYARFPESLAGKTFSFPGPNCFGVAMYANENIGEIRGVDLEEFDAFTKSHCVLVAEPERGDIGTFHNGSDYIHAFIFLGNNLVLEKTGVDYVGKTPIHKRDINHTIYTFEASPECRRWGGGSRDCFNTLSYLRCDRGELHKHKSVLTLEKQIENHFADAFTGSWSHVKRESVKKLIIAYEEEISQFEETLLEARLLSFQKQLEFIK